MLAKKKMRKPAGLPEREKTLCRWVFPRSMPTHSDLHTRAHVRRWSDKKKARVMAAWEDVREAMATLMRWHRKSWVTKATVANAARGALIARSLVHTMDGERQYAAKRECERHPDLAVLFLQYTVNT